MSGKRATKKLDYKKLNSLGLCAVEDSMATEFRSKHNASVHLSAETPVQVQRAQADFIGSMEGELDSLEREEARLRLAVKVQEKKLAIQKLQRQLQLTTSEESANASGSHTPPENQGWSGAKWNDPQIYLHANNTKASKYRKIVDYVPKRSRQIDEEIKVADGMFLKMESSTSRLKVESITPSQWIVANSCILGEMINESEGDPQLMQTVLDYLSYTAKIGDLGGRFVWSSVMLYDDEYRDLQARHGFRWGMDSSHLSTVFLPAREPKPGKHAKNNPKPYWKNDKMCGYYNSGKKCPHEPLCKFAHSCEKCGKDHPKLTCTAGEKAPE